MAQESEMTNREKLANEIFKYYQEFQPEKTDIAIRDYLKILENDSEGVHTKEATDYLFLYDLYCENNLRMSIYHLNHALLDSAAALINSFPDIITPELKAKGIYEEIENIPKWKYESYAKIAEGYWTDGRREDARKYYDKANTYRGDCEKVCPPEEHLKYDPVEDTPEYLAIKDELEEKLYNHFKGTFRSMGFCLEYWSEKGKILRNDYGIKWSSPSAMNPHIIFD